MRQIVLPADSIAFGVIKPDPLIDDDLAVSLIQQLRADLDALVIAEGREVTSANRVKVGLGLDAWLILASFRTRQWLKHHHIPVVGRLVRILEMALFGVEISLDATLGTGVYIVHSHAVVIGGSTVLGSNVKLLGSNTFGNSQGNGHDYPTVGNDVVIGAGVRVVGALTIGDRAKIGANAVVTADIPADAVAVGIPAKVVA
jgi:serine O-acetyltransferase